MSETSSETTSMENSFLELYREEDRYWWSISRRSLVSQFLKKYIQFPQSVRLLDVGCGGGGFLASLGGYFSLFGLEYSFNGAVTTSLRTNAKVVRGAAENLPFKDGSFGVITSLDVLEHLEDESKALRSFHRVLDKRGLLLLTVPAFNILWSPRDLILNHKRRYTLVSLRRVLEKAGFEVVRCTYTDSFYFPGLLLYGLICRFFKQTAVSKNTIFVLSLPAWLGTLFEWFLRIERKLLKYINIPLGVSIICVARKKGDGV